MHQDPIWHPYTAEKPHICIDRARGAYLYTKDNRTFIDMISSWWVNIHGHAHPYIAQTLAEQAHKLEQVIFADFTHEPAMKLAQNVLALLPFSFEKVFFSDNGSTAVEVALKMAIQYWVNKGQPRRRILAFHNSYHGDTFGAMSMSAKGSFTRTFSPFLFEVEHIPAPTHPDALLNQPQYPLDEYACIIYEPLLQGAGGMIVQQSYLLERLLHRYKGKTLLIADEILTGWGRTGTLFASERTTVAPDIICLSKGVTGGFLPLGLTVCTQAVYASFQHPTRQTFFHGHSFCGSPLACASANASIALLQCTQSTDARAMIAASHEHFCSQIAHLPHVYNSRTLGTIFACELAQPTHDYHHPIAKRVKTHLLSEGIYTRPLGNTLYFMPPYCIHKNDLEKVYSCTKKMLKQESVFSTQ